MLLETLYNGIACKTASGESRCNVIKINDLDRACDRSVGGADASDHLIERELLRAWIEVRRTLSWGLGFELESITPDLRLTVCSTLERLILESEPETSGAFTNRNTNEAVVEDFFSARACLYPTIAGCPRSSLSAPGRSVKMAPQAKRFVLVVGIEGAGHHLIGAIAKEIMYGWRESSQFLAKYGYRFKNYDPGIFLHQNRLPVYATPEYSTERMDESIARERPNASIFFQAESYPMGGDSITRHPDLYTFSRLQGGAPVAIFVRRDLSAATLSLLRRYGKSRIRVGRRAENDPKQHPLEELANVAALHKELEVKETSAFFVEASYQALCTV